ncbi:hypothetical protein F4821DRAFT_236490 [Hypoxylon rubiginosum]|uniref:Uncharacterized protein n=1 Tax=Hypoxylon rubiginosum TaxID=110542 RepID=A0ACC0D430_9PEZI|nr:hypothetical protein F4821DRAFT_236490 [Hypoxylon rubiginosum]
MSASASLPPAEAEAPDITCIAPDPFEPIPLIADILRTGYCIPGSVFLVEGVDTLHTSRSKRWRVVRLMLGDGELCVQALLSTEMHRFVDRGEVAFGSYIKLERFRLGWKDVPPVEGGRSPAAKGKEKEHGSQDAENQMVYLVVEDLVLVGWNNTLVDGPDVRNAQPGMQVYDNEPEAEEEEEEVVTPTARAMSPKAAGAQSFDSGVGLLHEAADADDDFEAIPNAAERAIATRSRNNEVRGSSDLPWSILDSGKPLKLTKLRSIPNLPYKQNWSVNTLAVISAISDLEPSGLPPYSQRQARLADPSTDKHVLLTVFLDPEQFAPAVGSVVLLIGVKNHRFDGGSLKKYVSDQPKSGYNWWYENPTQFQWCDVEGLRRWWEESQLHSQH